MADTVIDSGTTTPLMSSSLHGRQEIFSDEEQVTEDNIVDIIQKAMLIHEGNRVQEDYLWNYYKGLQPSLFRVKTVRPEITSHIVENRASEIVNFKVGYLCGNSEAIQYISKGKNNSDDSVSEGVARLNDFMNYEDKPTKDKTLFDWNHICGIAYRMIMPDSETNPGITDECPFEIYTLDPRNTFVVKRNNIEKTPLLGVNYIIRQDDGVTVYSAYTKNMCYTIEENKIVKITPHFMGDIPIIEYPLNQEKMGAFEVVITLLDAMNQTACERQEGVEGFIQALLKFHNVKIDSTQYEQLRQEGAIQFEDVAPDKKADVDYIHLDLDQTQIQKLVDYQHQAVLEICGMPSMSNGATSDSSNNGAVIMKNGWQVAESRATNTENQFKVCEKKLIEIALRICDSKLKTPLGITPMNVKTQFTRRNYEDIQSKSQVLTTMLTCTDKNGIQNIDPKLAYEHCGMFVDAERAYIQSKEFKEKQIAENEKKAKELSASAQANMQESSNIDGTNANPLQQTSVTT